MDINFNKEMTLEKVSYHWLNVNKNKYKLSTYQVYKYKIDRYICSHYIAHYCLSSITEVDTINLVESLLERKLSPKTVNDIISILNSILDYAEKHYAIKHISIQYVRNNYKEMRVLSPSEQKKLEISLKHNMDNYKFGIYLALYTGIRIGELCALKWSDINSGAIVISKTAIRIRNGKNTEIIIDSPKTNNSYRTIPIPSFLNNIIETRRKNPDDYILSTEKLSFVEPRLMQIHFKKIVNDCNISDVSFHALRHTFATRCVECGFDIKSLSEILGHSNIQITLDRYVHSSMALKKKNMDKLQKIYA